MDTGYRNHPIAMLASYPAFRYAYWRGTSGRFLLQGQVLLAGTFAALLYLSAHLDDTLTMKDGVGLLQHPGIFIYLFAQCIIPYATLRGITNLIEIPATSSSVLSGHEKLAAHLDWFRRSLLLETSFGKLSYGLLSSVGLAAFAWNCYQNQMPIRFLGFDFWDSAYHSYGYWSTRFYKLYVVALLAPAIVHVQVVLVITVRRILLDAARSGHLRLEPYHPDGCGGVRALIDYVLNPMVPVLFTSSAMTFAAFFVHKKYDITTVGGLALTCALFLTIYFVPAITLRKAIIIEKKRQLSDVARRQGKFYSMLMLPESDKVSVKDIVNDLDCLSSVGKHILMIPNWPQFTRAVKLVSLAGSSPILGWASKQLSTYATNWLGSFGLAI